MFNLKRRRLPVLVFHHRERCGLLRSMVQFLLHPRHYHLPLNQYLYFDLRSLLRQTLHFLPLMSTSICANWSSWDSLLFGPLAVSRASNTSAYLWRSRDELLVLIVVRYCTNSSSSRSESPSDTKHLGAW